VRLVVTPEGKGLGADGTGQGAPTAQVLPVGVGLKVGVLGVGIF